LTAQGSEPSEFRVQRVQGSEFRVQGSGFRVQGSGFRVQGSRFRVEPGVSGEHCGSSSPAELFKFAKPLRGASLVEG
jgi:hypothetical protein